MKTNILNIRKILMRIMPAFLLSLLIFASTVYAGNYSLSDNNNLIKGCGATIEIKMDTEGANVIASDVTLNISASEVKVNQVSIGSPLPMQVFNQFTDTNIKLSGARLPLSGAYTGKGTYGYINFMPSLTSDSGTFTFAPNLTIDNNMVDENINNVLTKATSKTYLFKDRFNVDVDGVGFCTPDTLSPNVTFIAPQANSVNNPINANLIFTITDNRVGVDMDSLAFSVNKINYTQNSPQVTIEQDGSVYRVEANPDQDFAEGALIPVNVYACDKNVPANCATRTMSFKIFEPAPPPAVCGNNVVEPVGGEQCDDGNKVSGDGCSAFCLTEVPPPPSPTCTDGLHNQGEDGIDCGGSCPNACPTCVDGIKNQNEESVDCGGPCPQCGEGGVVSCSKCPDCPICEELKPAAECITPEYKLITICHYSEDENANPYSLVIRDIDKELPEYMNDSVGPCALEDIIVPIEPEVEENAINEAEVKHGTDEAAETVKKISTLQTEAQVLDRIDQCKQNSAYAAADFDDRSSDTDGDGLSDRMECYAETNPLNPNTDGDDCNDGDEFNQFNTDPLDGTDCIFAKEEAEEEATGFNQVLISDPKPGWTLGRTTAPRFSGITPVDTDVITVTAFHADQKIIKALSDNVNELLRATNISTVEDILIKFEEPVKKARLFIEKNSEDFNYTALETVIALLDDRLPYIQNQIDSTGAFVMEEKQAAFGEIGSKLNFLFKSPITIGSINVFSPTVIGEDDASSFQLISKVKFEDKKLYDTVATATLDDGSTINSAVIRFGINTGLTTNTPIPRTLGGVSIPGQISFNGRFIDLALAQSDEGRVEIEITDNKPMVTGDTDFGSQVFAIWNSVVLSSSVISDSEKGTFEIQAPKNLESGTHHRVTLYAARSLGEQTVRSESVDVYFRIREKKISFLPIIIMGSIVIFFVFGIVAVRRIRSRSDARIINLLKSKK